METKTQYFTTKEIAYLSLCTAAAVVGRMFFQFIPSMQPMTDIFLLLAIYYGIARSLLVTILSVTITSLYMGVGFWTFSQICSYTVIVVIVGLLAKLKIFKKHIILQILAVFLAGLVYGFIISLFEVKMFGMKAFWPYYFAGFSFDMLHAIGNAGFYLLLLPFFSKKLVKKNK